MLFGTLTLDYTGLGIPRLDNHLQYGGNHENYVIFEPQGITTERIDETGASCVTSTLGTYAIIAEKIEPPFPYEVMFNLFIRQVIIKKRYVIRH